MTAVVAIASASFASPMLVKSGAVARLAGHQPSHAAKARAPETLTAGDFDFRVPSDWVRLGASSAEDDAGPSAAGTVVAVVCPEGRGTGGCADGVRVAFLGYRGGTGHALPLATTFETQLDDQLPMRIHGMRKVDSATKPSADGSRYLRYSFTYARGRAQVTEVLGSFRSDDGSGVVAVATGPTASFSKVAKDVDEVLASAAQSASAA